MKFYITKFKSTPKKVKKTNAIILKIKETYTLTMFFKNGKLHNYIKAAIIDSTRFKEFYLNGEYYGNSNKFTKKTWRKFVKIHIFL
jgi:hypothetical protein